MCPSTLSKKLSTAEPGPRLPLCCQGRPSWPSLEVALRSLAWDRGRSSMSRLLPFSLSLSSLFVFLLVNNKGLEVLGLCVTLETLA